MFLSELSIGLCLPRPNVDRLVGEHARDFDDVISIARCGSVPQGPLRCGSR